MTLLATGIKAMILSMKKALIKAEEVDGAYSINVFKLTKKFEFPTPGSNDFVYVRSRKHGDHVYVETTCCGKVEQNLMWSEHMADSEMCCEALTADLDSIVLEGTVVCLMTDIGDHGNVHWVPGKYVTIPNGHMAMVSQAKGKTPGHITIVPAMELETV